MSKNKTNKEDYRDSEGFYTLIKRTPEDKKRVEKEDKRKAKLKNQKGNPYKKGGWKHELFKRLKKRKIDSRKIQDFHFLKAENYLISPNGEKLKPFNTRMSRSKLEKFSEKHKDAVILIQTGHGGIYTKIPVNTYLRLATIEKMSIRYSMEASYDGDEDSYTVCDIVDDISSIGELMHFINYYRQLVDGVMEIQAACCSYSVFDYKVKTMVIFEDDSSMAFKGDFNEVLKYFEFKDLI